MVIGYPDITGSYFCLILDDAKLLFNKQIEFSIEQCINVINITMYLRRNYSTQQLQYKLEYI